MDDDDAGPTAGIILFILLMLINAFFYGFEAAAGELNQKDIEKKAEEEKDRKSQRLLRMMGSPTGYGNALLMSVTLANMLIGAFCLRLMQERLDGFFGYLLGNFGENLSVPPWAVSAFAAVIAAAVLLYILLTFGILLPRKIAVRVPEKWAYASIGPIYGITALLRPFTKLVTASAGLVMRICGAHGEEDEGDVTEEEIISMVNEGHEQGVIQASEAEMITNIFEYREKEAQDIMTHRNDIVAIDGSMPLKDAVSFILSESNSRYPVYEENIDHIIGILHLKDAMRFHSVAGNADKPVREVEGLLREAHFIPQTKNIDELFKQMQSDKLQMVIVIDEYGQTDGLVAMEDILEEIVGNIMDEYDEDTEYIEEKGENEYIIDGKTPLRELEERFDISFEDEEFETINGLLISRLDRIPEENEQFSTDVDGYNFKILKVENKMITKVLVTRKE